MSGNLESDGFSILCRAFSKEDCAELISQIATPTGTNQRGLLSNPAINDLARSVSVMRILGPHMDREPKPVRAIFFDKTPDRNWFVAWHQDVTLAVHARANLPGFGPWTEKDGIPHVHAPAEFLERMLTLRIHLDDADETNGGLRVIPGSHRNGKLNAAQIADLRASVPEHLCRVRAGDVLLMRPLLLHASRRSNLPAQRRILHIEYAACALPTPLEWHAGA